MLSKIPKKVNGGINIFGGVLMMISGNPAGAFYVASGAMSFGKGSGFDIASQVLHGVGAAMLLAGSGAATGQPGNGWLGTDAAGSGMPMRVVPGEDCPLCKTEDHYEGWVGLANMLMNEVSGLRGNRESLHKAQVAMGHVALNRAKLGWVSGLPPEELKPAEAEAIANRYGPSVEAYSDAKAAAAEVVLNPNVDPTGGSRYYVLDFGRRLPSYYRGRPVLEFGPFINAAGGGDVPKGATVYIRIFH